MKPINIEPADKLTGRIVLPGDKSISHRSIMLGSLAEGITEAENFEGNSGELLTWMMLEWWRRYGATKASSEAYLLGFSAKSEMRCNIIRPGYTFGNPAYPDGVTQPDKRFREIVAAAKRNEPITVTKHDGTQFIWAGDLARLYAAVLKGDYDREVFFGLAKEFVTWEKVALKAVEITGSKSMVNVEDKGWDAKPMLFDLTKIKREFGFEFLGTPEIERHLEYLVRIL